MTYPDACKLIGTTVERRNPAARRYTVRDVTNERDGSHIVHLSGGQAIPLEDFDSMYKAVQA